MIEQSDWKKLFQDTTKKTKPQKHNPTTNKHKKIQKQTTHTKKRFNDHAAVFDGILSHANAAPSRVKHGGLETRRLEGLRTPPKSAPKRGSNRAGGRGGRREVSRAEANKVEATAWARLAIERDDQAPLVKLADEASCSFCCNIACDSPTKKGFIEPSSWQHRPLANPRQKQTVHSLPAGPQRTIR